MKKDYPILASFLPIIRLSEALFPSSSRRRVAAFGAANQRVRPGFIENQPLSREICKFDQGKRKYLGSVALLWTGNTADMPYI
jgi:hypothetical protein